MKRAESADKEFFRLLCYDLIEYLSPFENEDGLLEKLDKWNFVEWSDANKWVMDVNYPTNMLYSKILAIVGQLYEDEKLIIKSEVIKENIIKQAFNGTFFVDNAVRDKNNILILTQNHSEACQYYALFFEVAKANDERFKILIDTVLNVFGPERKANKIMPEIAYANAFIGNYLRMELLLRWGKYEKLLDEIKKYFYKMAEITGTLWEHDSGSGSLNHGFASFVGVAIIKALSGINEINIKANTITVDKSIWNAPEAYVEIGTKYGDIIVKFEGNTRKYDIPEEFKMELYY